MSTCSEPSWSKHCAEFAAGAVLAATGRDIWEELGGCPRSWREAAEVYKHLGVTNLKDAVTAILGPPLPPQQAMRNDIALVRSLGLPALGIVRGDLVECMDNLLPIWRAECCWRVNGGGR